MVFYLIKERMIKKNIKIHIVRKPIKENILHFGKEDINDFLKKYSRKHIKLFNLYDFFNSISLFAYNYRFLIIFLIYCIIRLFY